jgi:hypothetical protein
VVYLALGDRKLLPGACHQNLHLITFELAQQAFAQRRARGDDGDRLPHHIDFQARRIRCQKQPLLATVLVFQAQQRADFYAALLIVRTQWQVLAQRQRLLDFLDALGLAGRQVRRLQSQGVVFVLGDVFFVGRGFVGGLRGALGDIEVDASLSRISWRTACLFMVINRRIAGHWPALFARRVLVLLQPELAFGVGQVARLLRA